MAVDLDLACQVITQQGNMMIGYHNAAVQHGIDMTERVQELVQKDNENITLRIMIRESGLEYIVLPRFLNILSPCFAFVITSLQYQCMSPICFCRSVLVPISVCSMYRSVAGRHSYDILQAPSLSGSIRLARICVMFWTAGRTRAG